MDQWLSRERRTGQLVRACFDHYIDDAATPDKIHALCRLTWISKSSDPERDVPDNTVAIVAPALSTLTGRPLSAEDPSRLGRELERVGAPEDVVRAASRAIGFTNFYPGFRKIALGWIKRNRRTVLQILRVVARAQNVEHVHTAYQKLEALPPLPRPDGGDMPAFSLITPVLACLDAGGRAPIINGRSAVQGLLTRLGLSSVSLAQQCKGLTNLIRQGGFADAFALDRASDDEIARALRAGPPSRPVPPAKRKRPRKPLAVLRDHDLEYLRSVDTVAMRRLHNRMTNALQRLCEKGSLSVERGSERACLFDALVHAYDGERDLLIEAKSDGSPASCRLAVGQLLDYRRQLPNSAAVDLAVLLPKKPGRDVQAFLGFVGVKAIWFNGKMSLITGDIRIGRGYT